MLPEILIIDDEEIVCKGISRILSDKGYAADYTTEGMNVIMKIKEKEYDLVLLDYKMPEKNGIELIREIKKIQKHIPIIMISAFDEVPLAVEAMKVGANDFFVKSSYGYTELLIKIEKILEIQKLRRNVDRLQETLVREFHIDRFIGKDPKIRKILDDVRKIAQTPNTPILISGESGTGKEVVAKYIHYLSKRKKNPFIAVNCPSIAPGICESELFGYERGAFTDAKKDKQGIFELAHGGTLFLDEIGSMNYELQGNLLRVLEEKKFRRVGGTKDTNVDIRVISASNKNLKGLVNEGRFREDLLYRLNAFQIKLPPLRDRRDDIIEIAYFFMEKGNRSLNKNFEEIDFDSKDLLYHYDYPGNVRELKNIIERAMIIGDGRKITPKHLSLIIQGNSKLQDYFCDDSIMKLKDMERKYIMKVLKLCKGNKTEASRRLGISRSTINLHLKYFKE